MAVARATAEGHVLAIENHQDFTSRELVDFCDDSAPKASASSSTPATPSRSPKRRSISRGVIAPHVRHVHLKDYRVQFTDEGYRLVRCAIGDGAVPFAELFAILGRTPRSLTAVLEPGALEARHVRLFTPDWWHGYPPKTAPSLPPACAAAQRNRLPDDADYRTPWEREDDAALVAYELDMIRRSAANMRKRSV